jgi:ferric-dicitrate binding protein FerR (iron transport regulator)
MDYKNYQVKDFLLDDFFLQWVKQPDEATEAFWSVWLEENPEKAATVAQARYLLKGISFESDKLSEKQVNHLWQNISRSISETEDSQFINKPAKSIPFIRRPLWSAAAVLFLVAVSAVFYFLVFNEFKYDKYQTAYGEKKTICLPDGSYVVLNAHSQLKFLKNWQNQKDRNVWLDGEAFFEVKKQPSLQPKFRVHTNKLTVEVLGTKFNVLERNEKTTVVLNEGKIKLDMLEENAEKNIFMQPGDVVKVEGKEQKLVKISVQKPENHSSWIKDYWILENTTLSEVAEKIENTYGLEVIIKNKKVAQESMNGALPTKNIDELLEVLSVTYNVTIQTNHYNQILIF